MTEFPFNAAFLVIVELDNPVPPLLKISPHNFHFHMTYFYIYNQKRIIRVPLRVEKR